MFVGHSPRPRDRWGAGIDLVAGTVVLQARCDIFRQDALERRGDPAHRSPRFKPLLLLGARTRVCHRDRNAQSRASPRDRKR